ncbi:uncharacterized protein [Amphiura filiformis]|uniref:uncharacterized protein n=1 Tax=Amphiura filiformis TaxID=82378 RepID=UPI003B21E885
MTHISWIVTSLLVSLLVALTVGCTKLTNGNWMKKIGDVRNEDGYWGKRSQGQRLSQLADLSNSRRVRNRRNQGGSADNDFESDYFSSSVDENAIIPEPPDSVLTREEQEEQKFQNIDHNGDGIVTEEEYRLAIPDMDDVGVQHMFLSFDRNNDGFITRAEFFRQRGIFQPDNMPFDQLGPEPAFPTFRPIQFQRIDLNGDGSVSEEEFRLAGIPDMDDIGVQHVFLLYDRNNDGFITMAEIMRQQDVHQPETMPFEQLRREPKNTRECTQQLMEVCDSQFINSTQEAREDPSQSNICNSFQVYIDCLARESQLCQAEDFTEKILSIASGLRDEGACPDLHLSSVRYPDLMLAKLDSYVNSNGGTNHQQQQVPGRGHHRQQEEEERPPPQFVDIIAEPLLSMYGSGNKEEEINMDDFRYGQQFEMFGDLMLADDEAGTGSSSPSAFVQDSKVVKSNHDRTNVHNANRDSTRTRDRTGSHDPNVNLYDTEVTTPLVEELSQLPQYDDEREQSKSDTQTVTSSWRNTTPKHHHRHHHTSRTQSSEHLQSLHIRQVRSTTTKKTQVQKSKNRSRSNCSVSMIWPCNQAFITSLAQGDEDPCESLVRFRHCVHKNTRHCMDTNVFKIREGLKYLSKEHRRAKLCRQITL